MDALPDPRETKKPYKFQVKTYMKVNENEKHALQQTIFLFLYLLYSLVH